MKHIIHDWPDDVCINIPESLPKGREIPAASYWWWTT